MKISILVLFVPCLIHGLSPTKSMGKLSSLSRATQKVRKFVKGVTDFVSSKKPGSRKKPNKGNKTHKANSRRPRKNTRSPKKTKATKNTPTQDSGKSSAKEFAGQLVVAGVGGGGLALIKTSGESDYEYEYTDSTENPTTIETPNSLVSPDKLPISI